MVTIVPSILEDDFSIIEQKVSAIKPFVDFVHYDVMDGEFVSGTSFRDPYEIEKLDIRLGVHLMIVRPEFEIRKWANLKNVDRIVVQVEAVSNFDEILKQAEKAGKEIGISFSPETRLQDFSEHIKKVKFLLIMGVEPGAAGQSMLPDTPEKVREAKKYFPTVKVSVDGGVNEDTKKSLVKAGVDELVVNTAIFHKDDIAEAIKNLQA